jgi:hypothetical protein
MVASTDILFDYGNDSIGVKFFLPAASGGFWEAHPRISLITIEK